MSRSINLKVGESLVISHCRKHGVAFFATESLPHGGTRIFCKTDEGADEVRFRFRDHVLAE